MTVRPIVPKSHRKPTNLVSTATNARIPHASKRKVTLTAHGSAARGETSADSTGVGAVRAAGARLHGAETDRRCTPGAPLPPAPPTLDLSTAHTRAHTPNHKPQTKETHKESQRVRQRPERAQASLSSLLEIQSSTLPAASSRAWPALFAGSPRPAPPRAAKAPRPPPMRAPYLGLGLALGVMVRARVG